MVGYKKIVVKKPSTFFSVDENLKIYDSKNNIFYSQFNKRKNITFNLPIGIFWTKNNILSQPIFKPYEFFKYPQLFDLSKGYKASTEKNENKATVNTLNKTIKIDPKFANHIFRPVPVFLLGHELGHLVIGANKYDNEGKIIFDAEKACDEISKNYMLSHGWNPTQVAMAVELTNLRSKDRKNCVHNDTIHKFNFR